MNSHNSMSLQQLLRISFHALHLCMSNTSHGGSAAKGVEGRLVSALHNHMHHNSLVSSLVK
jgi:hypothetical protein